MVDVVQYCNIKNCYVGENQLCGVGEGGCEVRGRGSDTARVLSLIQYPTHGPRSTVCFISNRSCGVLFLFVLVVFLFLFFCSSLFFLFEHLLEHLQACD